MRDKKDNTAYIKHIRDAIRKITVYASTRNFSEFASSEWDQDAVMRNLEIIGEAANNLEDSFKNKHSSILWRRIIGLRNILVHDYSDIDVKLIWHIITVDIKELLLQIDEILKSS